ncbi:hypothetical protein KCV87_18365 [Actinosynnema pretiosum subsp. pretiosum]|uniref:DnaJ domain protein n=2 Tax=Actinosynnema TaxID=40566 RepID=C6WHV0_ACTMD|nr:hypothetical protein [Actinosynnema mirum]ACU34401.1 DnaJ domain protein [Actinosynnema mirum DSM 43827]AXX27772.1 hypothetical protein APASM_0407 [Actinosynnema pretiosum subsp. pretiosum]QUF01533.1 hypothetical protein KCV87_18365 [Actinosynnema pretiosum subsp. pretiosum]
MNVRKDFFDHAIGRGEPPVELDFEAIEREGADALRRRRRVVPALAMAGVAAVAGGIMALATGAGSTGGLVEQGSGGGDPIPATPAPPSRHSQDAGPSSAATDPSPAGSTPPDTGSAPSSTAAGSPQVHRADAWTLEPTAVATADRFPICFSKASMAGYGQAGGPETVLVRPVPTSSVAPTPDGVDRFDIALDVCRQFWTDNTRGWRAPDAPVPALVRCVLVLPQSPEHGSIGVYPGDEGTCRELGFPVATPAK